MCVCNEATTPTLRGARRDPTLKVLPTHTDARTHTQLQQFANRTPVICVQIPRREPEHADRCYGRRTSPCLFCQEEKEHMYAAKPLANPRIASRHMFPTDTERRPQIRFSGWLLSSAGPQIESFDRVLLKKPSRHELCKLRALFLPFFPSLPSAVSRRGNWFQRAATLKSSVQKCYLLTPLAFHRLSLELN